MDCLPLLFWPCTDRTPGRSGAFSCPKAGTRARKTAEGSYGCLAPWYSRYLSSTNSVNRRSRSFMCGNASFSGSCVLVIDSTIEKQHVNLLIHSGEMNRCGGTGAAGNGTSLIGAATLAFRGTDAGSPAKRGCARKEPNLPCYCVGCWSYCCMTAVLQS